MADTEGMGRVGPEWPITNTMVHTRGLPTEVAVHRLGAKTAALVFRFGGASDVTIHVQDLGEITAMNAEIGRAIKALFLGEEETDG